MDELETYLRNHADAIDRAASPIRPDQIAAATRGRAGEEAEGVRRRRRSGSGLLFAGGVCVTIAGLAYVADGRDAAITGPNLTPEVGNNDGAVQESGSGDLTRWVVGDWSCETPPPALPAPTSDLVAAPFVTPAAVTPGESVLVSIDAALLGSELGRPASDIGDLSTCIVVTIQCWSGESWIDLYGVYISDNPQRRIWKAHRADVPFDLSAEAIEGDYSLTGIVPPELPQGSYRWVKDQYFSLDGDRNGLTITQDFATLAA